MCMMIAAGALVCTLIKGVVYCFLLHKNPVDGLGVQFQNIVNNKIIITLKIELLYELKITLWLASS